MLTLTKAAVILLALYAPNSLGIELSFNSTALSLNKATVSFTFKLVPQELLLKDSITISTDNPDITLSDWKATKEPVMQYIPQFHATMPIFAGNLTITTTVRLISDTPAHDAHIYISYLTSSSRHSVQEQFPLSFATVQQSIDQAVQVCHKPLIPRSITIPTNTLSLSRWSLYVEKLIQTSQLLWVRMILILILGLLMSFTPCIYPMIPITIGIMQGQDNRSVGRSFLHAVAYTSGIATTFALLGLFAAWSGTIFGSFLTHPLVVAVIVLVLIYLACSMFGFYELYIPRILQRHNNSKRGNSLVGSFIFGALSGTIASPCLSPGLALVLCIVANLGNALLGFLLLFCFGIGLSIPLLLIGTFSSSMRLLPHAGAWMVEVKKLFGLLLLALCFYYLKNIVPWNIIVWLVAFFCASVGIYYLSTVSEQDSPSWRRIKNIIGIIFLATAVHLCVEAYQTTFHTLQEEDRFWHTDFAAAHEQAVKENKLLFLDFWAPSCSICTAIDKTVLKDPAVRSALHGCIPVKIELSLKSSIAKQLKESLSIVGLPTFILLNPTTDTIVKRWGGELYQTEKSAFIEELKLLQAPL